MLAHLTKVYRFCAVVPISSVILRRKKSCWIW